MASTITVELSVGSAYMLQTCVEERLAEIDRLAAKHPTLPMKDPQTVAYYNAALEVIRKALLANAAEEMGIDLTV